MPEESNTGGSLRPVGQSFLAYLIWSNPMKDAMWKHMSILSEDDIRGYPLAATWMHFHYHTLSHICTCIPQNNHTNKHNYTFTNKHKFWYSVNIHCPKPCVIYSFRVWKFIYVSWIDDINVYVRLSTENHIVTLINTVQVSR